MTPNPITATCRCGGNLVWLNYYGWAHTTYRLLYDKNEYFCQCNEDDYGKLVMRCKSCGKPACGEHRIDDCPSCPPVNSTWDSAGKVIASKGNGLMIIDHEAAPTRVKASI